MENMSLGKPIDLDSSTSSRDCLTGAPVTKRAFHIDVVLEGTRKDTVGQATQSLLAQLGKPLSYSSFISQATSSSSGKGNVSSAPGTPSKVSKSSKQDPIRLGKIIQELQSTEQGYLRRISYLKCSYADPLRKFAKRKDTMIIPPYEANVMFANIDNLVISAEGFCRDLLRIDVSGRVFGQGIGDVCLRHLKELGTFDCYRAYYDRQDESQKVLQEMFKRQSFRTFTEGVKYQTSGIGNSGIRELLAEPVQRIPRYLLLWQAMIDSMSVYDTQRSKLEECIVLASRIAACEADERIKRATVLYCMERTVDAFPANLISNNRDYIDSIDVNDVLADYRRNADSMSQSGSSMRPSLSHSATSPGAIRSGGGPLHCTLILFDDKLVIVKRQSASISGRTVTGLDNIDRLMKAGGGLNGLAQSGRTLTKDKLVFKGVVDVLDVIATDVGNCEFQLFFEKPPNDLGEKWSGRPSRHYQVVHPPLPVNLDYTPAKTDKQRFVQNLWKAQALARTRLSASARRTTQVSQSTALPIAFVSNNNRKLEGSDKPAGQAISFWNVWEKAAWNAHSRKGKVVLHVDETGSADPVTVGSQGDPSVVIRATPLSTGDCRISVTSDDAEGNHAESQIIRVEDIDDTVSQIINVFGIYQFRTSNGPLPSTPSHGHRLRPSLVNMDNISKNLFGSGTISSRYETSVSSRKSRSVVSRSSTIDTARFSLESKSTMATSVELDLVRKTPSPKRARQSTSPQNSGLQDLSGMSPKRDIFSIDEKQDDIDASKSGMLVDASDIDLEIQLDIARKNSVSVATSVYPSTHSVPGSMSVTRMEYQGPASPQRGSLMIRNRTPSPSPEVIKTAHMTTMASPLPFVRPLDLPRRKTPSPTQIFNSVHNYESRDLDTILKPDEPSSSKASNLERGRSVRSNGSVSRPMGPRSARSSGIRPVAAAGSSYTSLILPVGQGRIVTPGRETVPLKGDIDETTTISPPLAHKRARSQEELAPRKRSADYTISDSNASTVAADPERSRSISMEQRQKLAATPQRHVSSTTIGSTDTAVRYDKVDLSNEHGTLLSYYAPENAAENTDEHVTVALRTSRNIRAELTELKIRLGRNVAAKDRLSKIDYRSPSLCRSPPSIRLSKRVALDPGERDVGYGSVSSRHSSSSSKNEFDLSFMDDWTIGVTTLLDQMDHDLEQAKIGSTRVTSSVSALKADLQKSALDLKTMQNRLEAVSAQNGLADKQITDLKSELEAVYEAFNVELDGLFADASLPADEAFETLKRDLKITTAQRNEMRLENIKLRRQLEEANLRNTLSTRS